MGSSISSLLFPVPTFSTDLPKDVKFGYTLLSEVRIPILHIVKCNSWPTVIYSHGNAECLSYVVAYLHLLADTCHVNVLCYEYIGYPHADKAAPNSFSSNVLPTESGCYESIERAHKYLTEECNVPESMQIYMGDAIGSGPTFHMVAKLCRENKPPRGMAVLSPFLSATCVVSEFADYFYSIFPNYRFARDITCRSFLVHGLADEVIPSTHTNKLSKYFPLATPKEIMFPYLGHNNLVSDSRVLSSLTSFFAKE